MSTLTKEVLAEIGLSGLSLPRCLVIPMIPLIPETDLLNIQMLVMDMLSEDPEISKITAKQWNLGFEIKAFNVQNNVWDLLDPDNDLEIPHRASIQVNLFNNDPEDDSLQRQSSWHDSESRNLSRRDPRRKHRDMESQLNLSQDEDDPRPTQAPAPAPSRRDPRRKQASAEPEANLVIPPPLVDTVIKPVVIAEPNVKNLSRNDPRRRKLMMEKATPQSPPISISREVKEIVHQHSAVIRNNVSIRQDDSDSDDGGLQIDETFEEKEKNNDENRTLIMITESQLEVGNKTEKIDTSKDDVELWDEIYGSTNDDKDNSLKIFDPKLKASETNKNEIIVDKETMKTDERKQSSYFDERKSIEQLEKERELLLNLVKERDEMNRIVASVPPPEEIILDQDDLEEGELSDSEEEIKITKDSEVEILLPSKEDRMNSRKSTSVDLEIEPLPLDTPVLSDMISIDISHGRKLVEKILTPGRKTVSIDLDDFTSPASPTGIQLDLDNDEIDVIPLEREDQDEDIVEIIPKDRYKHYWDEFPDDEKNKKVGSDQNLFEVAREKLSKYKKQEEKSSPIFLRAAQKLAKVSPHLRRLSQEDYQSPKSPEMNQMEATKSESSNFTKEIPLEEQQSPRLNPNFKDKERQKFGLKNAPPSGVFLNATKGITPLQGSVKEDFTLPPPGLTKGPPAGLVRVPPPNQSSIFPPPIPTMRKNITLLDTPNPAPIFPNPVKAVESPPPFASINNTSPFSSGPSNNSPSSSLGPLQSFNSSKPPPASISNKYSIPPPSSSKQFPPFNSPPPANYQAQPVKPIPSLMTVDVKNPESQERPSIWKDGWRPLGKSLTKQPTPGPSNSSSSQSSNKQNKTVERNLIRKRSRSRNRNEIKSRRSKSPGREKRKRSRSRGRRSNSRSRKRSRSRNRRSNSRNRKSRSRDRDRRSKSGDRRSLARDRRSQSGEKRSRSRGRRSVSGEKRSRSGDRRSKSGDRRSKSGDRISNFPKKIKRSRTRSGEKRTLQRQSSTSMMQESDNLMLAFYEGGDCMIDEDEPSKLLPEPTPTVTKPPPISSRPIPSSSRQPSSSSFKPNMLPEPVRTTSSMFLSHLNTTNQSPSPGPNMHQASSPVTQVIANHPIQAVYEYNRKVNNPPPKFMERWGPGGGWAFDIELGPVIYSCPWFSPKKKDAKAEACKYALSQLGVRWGSQYELLRQ